MGKIYLNNKNFTLSHDGCVRIGKQVIGWWEKDIVPGSSHFRPSPYEGMMYYRASLNNGCVVDSYSKQGLREEIVSVCSEGIETVN